MADKPINAKPKVAYHEREARMMVVKSLASTFPYEDRSMLERTAGSIFAGFTSIQVAAYDSRVFVPESRVETVIKIAEDAIYTPRCESLIARFGARRVYAQTNISKEDVSDILLLSYITVEREALDEERAEALPRGKVTRNTIKGDQVKTALERGIESGEIIRGHTFTDLGGAMKYFDKQPGFVNAGLYDSEAAFRVITNPAHYAAKIYDEHVKKMRRIFDKCDFDNLTNIDVVSLMGTMDEIMAGEENIVVSVSAMGNSVRVAKPCEKSTHPKGSNRPKTAAEIAARMERQARDIASAETE